MNVDLAGDTAVHCGEPSASLVPGPCRHLLFLPGQDHVLPHHLFLEHLPTYLTEASSPESEGK